jgi:uncharacterized membrane protein
MENYSNVAQTPYGGYREALEAPNDFQASSSESYSPPFEGGYQQQEQLYGSQQYDKYQQQYPTPPVGSISPDERTSMGMRARTAGWLSYLGSWVTGLIFLLLERENRFVRFHAMQSLLFFGPMGILTAVFSQIAFLSSIAAGLWFVSFICWIVLMVKAARGRYYKLPIIGDYAEKWANSLRN